MAYAMDTRRSRRSLTEDCPGAQRRFYGALNAIGGLNGYGRYIFSPWDGLRGRQPIDPIYRGPCPPNPDGTDLEDVYAYFYQEGPLAVTGASPAVTTEEGVLFRRIELNSTGIISDEGIIKERTRILIVDPGVYYVGYNLYVPDGDEIDTTLALLYNREIISGTGRKAFKSISGMGMNVSADALIAVDSGGAELILGATDSFSLTPSQDTSLLSLVIFSIA